MKIVNPSFDILTTIDKKTVYSQIEKAARTCYKSESAISEESSLNMIKNLINRKHEAMLEHVSITVKFICDRGVSHEIVRHRMASFAQESQRYCNYTNNKFGNEITFIKPCFIEYDTKPYYTWKMFCLEAERTYKELIDLGLQPQEARAVLPNSTKTEIIMTANIREWRHFLNLRAANTTGPAHPQMRELAVPLLKKFYKEMPELFFDIYDKLPNYEKE